jgi:hypothetical protein
VLIHNLPQICCYRETKDIDLEYVETFPQKPSSNYVLSLVHERDYQRPTSRTSYIAQVTNLGHVESRVHASLDELNCTWLV